MKYVCIHKRSFMYYKSGLRSDCILPTLPRLPIASLHSCFRHSRFLLSLKGNTFICCFLLSPETFLKHEALPSSHTFLYSYIFPPRFTLWTFSTFICLYPSLFFLSFVLPFPPPLHSLTTNAFKWQHFFLYVNPFEIPHFITVDVKNLLGISHLTT